MSKKENVELHRGGDFDEMDELLNEALATLEASNERVLEILDGAKDIVIGAASDDDTEVDAAAAPAESAADHAER
jgi:hypothetical protein